MHHHSHRRIPSVPALALAAALLAACADGPTQPGANGAPPAGPEPPGGTGATPLGLVQVTISGPGDDGAGPTASAAPFPTTGGALGPSAVEGVANADDTGDGTIQLEPVSTGSFTDGERGAGGERYLRATFRVRNAQMDGTAYDTERRNLTFLAVDTDGSLGETAVTELTRFDGGAADPAIAPDVKPTGAATRTADGEVAGEFADVLQVLTEAEAASVDLTDHPTVNTVFPYGFVVRNPSTPGSRTLPASPAADQYDGIVTFAFRLPLLATSADDPFGVTVVLLAVDDTEARVTESLEERTAEGRAALRQRADELAAGGAPVTVTLLGNSGTVIDGHATRRLCTVRTAGADPRAPAATLVDAGAPCLDGEALPTNVRVVDPDAAAGGDGTTWASAYDRLQNALSCVRDNAGAGGACEGVDEIWVADGVHYPDEGDAVTADDETETFAVVPGVSLYGGFVGGEYRRDLRDPEANLTILSGDIGQDDTDADGNAIAETTGDIQGANSDHVVTADGSTDPITRATVLDGFTITAGHSLMLNGAGLRCTAVSGECSPTLRRLSFSVNQGSSGGAMFIRADDAGSEASPWIENVAFTGNAAAANGGAVHVSTGTDGTSSPVFTRVTFTGNLARTQRGGAVNLVTNGVTGAFYNAEFRNNESPGTGASQQGGAIAVNGAAATIVNSVLHDNRAGADGGALWVAGGSMTLVNVTLAGNQADNEGGAIGDTGSGSTVTLRNVIAWGNSPDQLQSSVGGTADNSIIEGGCGSLGITCTDVLDQDPRFVAAAGGDLRLGASSPAVDAGNNTWLPTDPADLDDDGDTAELLPLDLDDLSRVFDWGGDDATAAVDMGAYERQ